MNENDISPYSEAIGGHKSCSRPLSIPVQQRALGDAPESGGHTPPGLGKKHCRPGARGSRDSVTEKGAAAG